MRTPALIVIVNVTQISLLLFVVSVNSNNNKVALTFYISSYVSNGPRWPAVGGDLRRSERCLTGVRGRTSKSTGPDPNKRCIHSQSGFILYNII